MEGDASHLNLTLLLKEVVQRRDFLTLGRVPSPPSGAFALWLRSGLLAFFFLILEDAHKGHSL